MTTTAGGKLCTTCATTHPEFAPCPDWRLQEMARRREDLVVRRWGNSVWLGIGDAAALEEHNDLVRAYLERDAQLTAMTAERDEYRSLMEKEHQGWLDAEAREIAADSCPAGCIGGKILSHSDAPDVFCPHCMTGLRAQLAEEKARLKCDPRICQYGNHRDYYQIKDALAAMTAERDKMEIKKEKFRQTTLLARTERDKLKDQHHQDRLAIETLADTAKLFEAQLTASEAALLEATAELIYLRLYGKDGALWRANESKDVWRDKAREALAEPGKAGEPGKDKTDADT